MQQKLVKPAKDFSWAPMSIINREDLSLRAKGLWLFINSKPTGWTFSAERISSQNSDGRRAILTALKELEDNGLLLRKKLKSGAISYELVVEKSVSAQCDLSIVPKQAPISKIDTIVKKNNIKVDSSKIQKIYDIFLQKFNKSPNMFKLTPMRRAKIQARLTDAGEEMLTKAIENTANSPFHMGENDRGWKADLDFIVRSYEQVEKLANMTPRPPKGEEAIVLPRHLREEMEEFQRGLAEDLANERF